MMFNNLLYKFSIVSKNGYNDMCTWIGGKVAELMDTYGEDGLSKEVLLLSKDPKGYYIKTERSEKSAAIVVLQ